MRARSLIPAAAVLLCLPEVAAAQGSSGSCGDVGGVFYDWVASGQIPKPNNCQGSNGWRCYDVENTSSFVEKLNPSCNPSVGGCSVRLHATATVPGVRDMVIEDGLGGGSTPTPWAEWYGCLDANCPLITACGLAGLGGQIGFDNLDAWAQRGLSCSQAWTTNYSVKIRVCIAACPKTKVINIPGFSTALALGCPPPPLPGACGEDSGSTSGAAGMSCQQCQDVPGDAGCGVPVGGGGPSCAPSWLGNARLRYAAGGVGGDNLPGFTAWRTTLGRFWSHDYAERIVVDPDTPAPGHVWFLTRHGTFREFKNLAGGSGLRLYGSRTPSDEFRKLYFDTATSGWQLVTLDGRTDYFRPDGLWEKTVFASDPTHPTMAEYNVANELIGVSLPDGRSDRFTYHPSGKLASIEGVPVAGSGTPSRFWTFTWSGDELTLATRPDGIAWQFVYDAARPGYLTRVDLMSGPSLRVMAAFEYQAGSNNVAKSWRGDVDFNLGVDRVTYAYTNPTLPSQTVVTRKVSGTFDQVTTFAVGRDTATIKPKITSIQGTCPTCGLSPTTSFAYTGSNPLLPSSMTDAKGTRTDYTYNANGRLLTKTEAANVPSLTRTTSYTYDTNFPGLVTRLEVPSTSGGSNKRRTDSVYDPSTALLNPRTISGFEAGVAFSYATSYAYNASGEVTAIDPPGYGTTDQTTFTYNLAGRNGHVPGSRTDPLVGTTIFGYDGLNRRTSVIDVNGVETATSYDSLNRVTEVRQKGAVPADDLVTTYTYTSFGDLFCTKLPRGNGIEYVYDTPGRLKESIRGTAVATPTSTSCLDPTLSRERTAYQLDVAGNRIEESLERWSGGAWVSDSKTAYEFTCHLDKMTQGAGSPTTSVTEYCYDLNDNLEKVWDANHPKGSNPNPTQLYAYDALDRLTSVTVGPGTGTVATTSYGYDVQDHLASVIDAEASQTTYTTGDRDLQTQQVSPVSGTTTYAHNEHGELLTTTDARAMVTTRTVDAADRVIQETFGPAGSPDPTLTTTYAYGSTPAQFDVGRLTGITRNTQTIIYTYDRFGRVLQDGSLTSEYDKNGNRTKVTYPGSVSATWTHDFADREATFAYDSGGGPQSLVTGVGYKAWGPLTTLTLANGLTETRLFDARYFPDRIQAGSLLDWDYTVDAVGNPTAIAGTIAGPTGSSAYSAAFAYQDNLYFLTQGNGPWGSRAWTYDKIGNRLTFARASEPTLSYAYASAGHNPKLTTITPAPGWGTGSWSYSYDAAGNQTSILEANGEATEQTTFYDVAADGRMSVLRTSAVTGPSRTDFLYDGRGFLRQAHLTVTPPGDYIRTTPVYSSEGVLMARTEERQWTSATTGGDGEDLIATMLVTDTTQLFYFAGRPVAQLTTGPELLYLTTDHLGTPVLATSTTGTVVWAGGLEPFGATWTAGAGAADPEPSTTVSSVTSAALDRLSSERVFLRYPGQWASDVFRITSAQGNSYYNLHRWYESQAGRYISSDPAGGIAGDTYGYAHQSPVRFIDPFGLRARQPQCCSQSSSSCCEEAADKDLFRDDDGTRAGGIVVCCQGQKVACPGLFGNPLYDEPWHTIIIECATEHETDHFQDVNCRGCELYRPNFRLFVSQRRAECRATNVELACVARNIPRCGGNPTCLEGLEARRRSLVTYGEGFRRCTIQ